MRYPERCSVRDPSCGDDAAKPVNLQSRDLHVSRDITRVGQCVVALAGGLAAIISVADDFSSARVPWQKWTRPVLGRPLLLRGRGGATNEGEGTGAKVNKSRRNKGHEETQGEAERQRYQHLSSSHRTNVDGSRNAVD